MNALSTNAKTFPFRVEPIFKVYEEVNRVWNFANPERMLNYYDTVVNTRLKDLHFQLNPEEAENSERHPWGNLYVQSEEIIQNISEIIEMRPILEKKELLEVFQVYHIMYEDDYDKFHNFPLKEVW